MTLSLPFPYPSHAKNGVLQPVLSRSLPHQIQYMPFLLLRAFVFFFLQISFPNQNLEKIEPIIQQIKSVMGKPAHQKIPGIPLRILKFLSQRLRKRTRWKGIQKRQSIIANQWKRRKEIIAWNLTLGWPEYGQIGGLSFEAFDKEGERFFRCILDVEGEWDGCLVSGAPSPTLSNATVTRLYLSLTHLQYFTLNKQISECILFAYKLSTINGLKPSHLSTHIHNNSHYTLIRTTFIPILYSLRSNKFGAMGEDNRGKKSYKQALFSGKISTSDQNLPMNNLPDQHSPLHGNVEETCSNAAPRNKNEASPSGTKKSKGKEKAKIDMKAFLAQLSGVKENITHLKETSLFGFVLGEPIESTKLKPKLRSDWKLKGDFFIHERTNGWFEVRFTNPIERNQVWEGRPYHVFGQLLVLKPWKSNFDTSTESVTQVDMWIRIPQLPIEYLSFNVLNTIIQWNNLGSVIKLDPYTAKLQRLRYARVCINVDLQNLAGNQLIVPDENANEHTYNIWFEDFPRGCGFCGELSHTYNYCPMRIIRNQPITVTLSKPHSSKKGKEDQAGTSGPSKEEKWEKVGKTYPRAGDKGKGLLEEQNLQKKSGIHVIYKTDSSSSGSKESRFSSRPEVPLTAPVTGMGSNEELNAPSELPTPPIDDQKSEEHLCTPIYSPLSADNEEYEDGLDFMNEFLLNEENDNYDEDLTQAELEALLAGEVPPTAPMETSQSLESLHSLANPSSVVNQLGRMEVNHEQPSRSESSKRKLSDGGFDTATSVLKGGEAKKKKMKE